MREGRLGWLFTPSRESQVARWLAEGRPSPPPAAVKTRNLLTLADLFGIDTLVETGTYRGDMIAATLHRFERIYSIEIDPALAKAAQTRFRHAGKVEILEGDSAKLLPGIIRELRGPALFWLDGHYSGKGTGKGETDTPILAEVETIAALRQNRADIVIVDDARLFGRLPAYPQQDDFVEILRTKFGGQVLVADDSFFVLPMSRLSSSET